MKELKELLLRIKCWFYDLTIEEYHKKEKEKSFNEYFETQEQLQNVKISLFLKKEKSRKEAKAREKIIFEEKKAEYYQKEAEDFRKRSEKLSFILNDDRLKQQRIKKFKKILEDLED